MLRALLPACAAQSVRPGLHGGARLSRAARAGSFTSGLSQLVEKMRYTLYGKHRRTTFDASACARAPPGRPAPCG